MEQNLDPRRQDARSDDASVFPTTSGAQAGMPPPNGAAQPTRIGCLDGHLPEFVEPLVPPDPDTSFTETRRFRHDGWTPEKKRLFLEVLAMCGVVRDACEAAGMSARAAYTLRDRDPQFAAGWEAACVMARPRLADEAFSRSMNGVLERIYKDGVIVAERHRYDNRLTMAVLARLDARIDRAEEKKSPHLGLVARWEDYLAALGDDRRDEVAALLAPPAPEPAAAPADPRALADLRKSAGDRELCELQADEAAETEDDRHLVWEDEEGMWTDYPPPADFDGDEEGEYGSERYRRTLTEAEPALVAEEEEVGDADQSRVRAEAQRDAFFSAGPEPLEEGDEPPPPPPPG